MKTEHEGLATRVPFELTNKVLWDLLAQHAKQVAEGAGAASLAAAIKLGDQLRGKKVVGILTGGNIPLERFAAMLR
jgi:threonine dehydratase